MESIGSERHTVTFTLQQTLCDAAHRDRIVHHQNQRNLAGACQLHRCCGLASTHAGIVGMCHLWHTGTGHAHLLAIHRGECHRVVNQHHRTGRQHRHTSQTRQTGQLGSEVLHHDFLVAQNFVYVQGDALRGAAENNHRPRLARGFATANRCLQQRARPEERHLFRTVVKTASAVGRFEVGDRRAAHDFDDVGRNAKGQIARTQHDHLRHRRGQRQHHTERCTLTRLRRRFDAATQGIDLGAHHVHANAAPRKTRDLGGRGETR